MSLFKRAVLGALCLASTVAFSACGSSAHPAATVNGHDISMSAFHEQVYYQRQVAVDSGGTDQCQTGNPKVVCGQLKSSALTNLIDNELVQEYADRHHISVSQADFNREWAQVWKVRFQHNPALLNAFAKHMHVTESDLKGRVKQDMLRQAVLNHVVKSAMSVAPAIRAASIFVSTKKQATTVQAQLRAGTPFLTVATKLSKVKTSACATAGSCGDAGWVPTALLPPFQRFLLKERAGTPLGPYRLQQGYQFYLVEGISTHFAMTANQQAALRALAFSQWLARQESHATIKRYAAT
jgi:parvulin-like peptidyl-prolyl isomerase